VMAFRAAINAVVACRVLLAAQRTTRPQQGAQGEIMGCHGHVEGALKIAMRLSSAVNRQ
jgi:hypothetical protein